MRQYLGIDIGASRFKYGIGNSNLGLQRFAVKRITDRSIEGFRKIVLDIISETENQGISGICIGSPGTITYPEGKIVGHNPNLPFFTDFRPVDLIPEGIDIPVCADNDANLMALAEACLKPCRVCVGITIGSGIGCGVVHRKNIFHGAHGFAAEAGHMIVYPDGLLCSCGKKGCLEAYSSVDGIRRRLHDINSPYAGLDLPNLIASRTRIPEVDKYISEGEQVLIRGLANLCTVLDPDLLILGGGAMDFAIYNIQKVEAGIKELVPTALSQHLRCVHAGYGNRAGVMGGIILCEKLYHRNENCNHVEL
ncbi:MAG: ROK family protein [Candidatus Cloacimonetes bacterium]|nr:ROK family protein [Candidatus Cloacimonadota bacterium]MDD2506490.1 ROK family protein [Candidatus Cloacimonadota bacterium]MDD4147147.1 ROK family protein [Candidatus Cloacimonadota bacterium]MDD4560559.1 ROK family protein [Candidatus Cloacimonadota bacterium]